MKLIALLAAVVLVGCATTAPGNDPLVIRAEQLYGNAFSTCDEFLKWERANESVATKSVHEFAEGLRKRGPDAFRSLRAVTKAYKYNRSADNKATLETVCRTVEQILAETQSAISKSGVKTSEASHRVLFAVAPAVVIAAIDGLMRLVALISGMIAQAKRNKEWTPEEEALVDAMLESSLSQDHWKPKS